jgi:phage N-6-adenine-methyltransferase
METCKVDSKKMNTETQRIMFSSEDKAWGTPKEFFEVVQRRWNLTLDVCAAQWNAKLPRYFDVEMNGLKQSWKGERCWLNPPYGQEQKEWVIKAFNESREPGTLVVCLLPARTETKLFHDYCCKGEVRLLKGRLSFDRLSGKSYAAPFPSMLVIFSAGIEGRIIPWDWRSEQ